MSEFHTDFATPPIDYAGKAFFKGHTMLRIGSFLLCTSALITLPACGPSGLSQGKSVPSVEPPKVVNTPAAAEAKEAADLDRQIAEAEKKRTDLERQLTETTEQIAALKAKSDANQTGDKAKNTHRKLHKSLQELFEIPDDFLPKPDGGGAPQREVANKWMKDNRVGHDFEWTTVIKEVLTTRVSDGVFEVMLGLPYREPNILILGFFPVEKAFPLNGSPWEVIVQMEGGIFERHLVPTNQGIYPAVCYASVSSENAKKMADWKGKKVTLRATIEEAKFDYQVLGDAKDNAFYNVCSLTLTVPTINNWSTPILKAK